MLAINTSANHVMAGSELPFSIKKQARATALIPRAGAHNGGELYLRPKQSQNPLGKGQQSSLA